MTDLFFVKYVTGVPRILINLEYLMIYVPICRSTAISTFPILPNEEFTFDFDEKHGVELEFGIRKGKGKGKGRQ